MTVTNLLVSTLATLSLAHATVLFHNNGTLTGWHSKTHNMQGETQEIETVHYDGKPGLRMKQVYCPTFGPSDYFHSEVELHDIAKKNEEQYYGFAFQLRKDWNFTEPYPFSLARFRGRHGYGCHHHAPGTTLWVEGGELKLSVKYGSVCPGWNDKEKDRWFNLQCRITAGVWHKVIIGAYWRDDAKGFIKVWLDGKLVLNGEDLSTFPVEKDSFDFLLGVRSPQWRTLQGEDRNKPVTWEYEAYFDAITVATTQGEADPGEKCP
ncbi:hypothetical protein VTJ83DRAFT_3188 [Remersonia thermophila]|uniref:Polysaccharide lyase n=1 Tax=Remersonia thermophila TaxID=72144 RepID=A0ABR4DDF3_9PEZI